MATRHRRTVGQSSKSRNVRQRRGHFLEGRTQAPSRSQVVLVYLFLTAITWLVFGQTVSHDFVNFDDHVYIYDNPLVTGGLTSNGIVGAFSHPHARNWHPLTTISHMLDCQLYGLSAGGHHFTNVVLHTIAVLLLFRVLRVATGALWPSAFVAALFAIHPLHVESVAWVSERKDVLSGLFFVLMLGAYVRYGRAPSIGRYLAVAVLFAAGLMSKSMLVTAPFVLLLLDYWPLSRFERPLVASKGKTAHRWNQRPAIQRLLLEKIPLLVLSAAACGVTFVLQKQEAGAIPPLPFAWRAENAFTSYVTYLWKTFWPTRLAVFYPHPNNSLPIWEVILAIAFLVAITAAAIGLRKQRGYLFTGWFWYLGMLVPVIGVVQVGEQGHADRYTYLPQIGLFLMVVWGAAELSVYARLKPHFVATTAAAIVVAFGWTAFVQRTHWKDSETLWNHALAVTSNNDVAHNNLGFLCADRGDMDKAISHFEAALRIRASKPERHYDLGSAFVQMNLGDALARKGRPDEAILHYREAIKLQPNYADAYYNLGSVLFAKSEIDEAIAQWRRTLELEANYADAYTGIGNALLQRGLLKEAISHYEKAREIAPQDPHSRNNVAWVLATSPDASIRDGSRAVKLAQEAVDLSGGKEPQFLRTLAAAYAEDNRFGEAISAAKQGFEIASAQGDLALAEKIRADVALYRNRTPLRRVFSSK